MTSNSINKIVEMKSISFFSNTTTFTDTITLQLQSSATVADYVNIPIAKNKSNYSQCRLAGTAGLVKGDLYCTDVAGDLVLKIKNHIQTNNPIFFKINTN